MVGGAGRKSHENVGRRVGVLRVRRGQPVLWDVAVAARLGEMLAVTGTSGAGKTTLLIAAAGDGQSVHDLTVAAPQRHHGPSRIRSQAP
jgi:ABC-type hemin transport system ATPase subunit